jgi:hypothetical protein
LAHPDKDEVNLAQIARTAAEQWLRDLDKLPKPAARRRALPATTKTTEVQA